MNLKPLLYLISVLALSAQEPRRLLIGYVSDLRPEEGWIDAKTNLPVTHLTPIFTDSLLLRKNTKKKDDFLAAKINGKEVLFSCEKGATCEQPLRLPPANPASSIHIGWKPNTLKSVIAPISKNIAAELILKPAVLQISAHSTVRLNAAFLRSPIGLEKIQLCPAKASLWQCTTTSHSLTLHWLPTGEVEVQLPPEIEKGLFVMSLTMPRHTSQTAPVLLVPSESFPNADSTFRSLIDALQALNIPATSHRTRLTYWALLLYEVHDSFEYLQR